MSYYIAVDGGGTKTVYALLDRTGEVIDTFTGGGTNHENFSNEYDGLYFAMYESIHGLLQKNEVNIDQIEDAVFGLAGADHSFQVKEISKRLKMIGLKTTFICNDGFLPIKSSTPFGVGIAYNAGTGISCTGINDAQTMMQIGGLGGLTGDYGGGSHIAQIVYRSIYDELFLNSHKTAMTKLYLEKFNLSSVREFYNSTQLMTHFSEYAFKTIDIFFEAFACHDSVAVNIAKTMAERCTLFIKSVYRHLKFNGIAEVVLTGSIHTKVAPKSYVDIIKGQLGGNYNVNVNTSQPVQGAIKWVKERNGL